MQWSPGTRGRPQAAFLQSSRSHPDIGHVRCLGHEQGGADAPAPRLGAHPHALQAGGQARRDGDKAVGPHIHAGDLRTVICVRLNTPHTPRPFSVSSVGCTHGGPGGSLPKTKEPLESIGLSHADCTIASCCAYSLARQLLECLYLFMLACQVTNLTRLRGCIGQAPADAGA